MKLRRTQKIVPFILCHPVHRASIVTRCIRYSASSSLALRDIISLCVPFRGYRSPLLVLCANRPDLIISCYCALSSKQPPIIIYIEYHTA